MRNVVLYHLQSLDGVAFEDADWFDDGGPEMFANLARVIETQDDVLLGRNTYDYWAGYWPESDVQPFADFINGTRKHVFTSNSFDPEWANTTVVSAAVEEYVRALKAEPGRDIGIHGSIDLSASLLRAGLVNELRLVVAPALAGAGRRVLDAGDAIRRLELLDVQQSPKGTLFLAFRV